MGQAGEVGFVEDFALAEDRSKAIEQLVPGTEDFYYYRCLHQQNTRALEDADETLKLWGDRYGKTQRYREMETRQELLSYERDPKKTFQRLKRRLGLTFQHERRTPEAERKLPTALDGDLISPETLKEEALSSHSDLGGFTLRGLWRLEESDLDSVERVRYLLRHLDRPDFPGLPSLVARELEDRRSSGFGSLAVHGALLLAQLDECARLRPALLGDDNFVAAYLMRLQPGVDTDLRRDPMLRREHLERLLSFVRRLPESQNALRAHVLYHRLAVDMELDIYDPSLFEEYVKLPRAMWYISKKLEKLADRAGSVDLGTDFSSGTLLGAIGSDEALVRAYLAHFFEKGSKWESFKAYMKPEFLKKLYAETMILAGKGDTERWYALLDDPGAYQALKERVDIEFAPTNGTYFDPDDPVALDVYVKNVKTLIVKVFEINTSAYCRQTLSEVDTAIDLDGLVASDEKVHTYDETPFVRSLRRFEFPDLARRGVFVVEFIGNGRSSRALISKGRLRMLERVGAAGHVLTVLDEQNRKLTDASAWLQGHEYRADADGHITVPFSTQPSDRQPVVLAADGFSTLDRFSHKGEDYSLEAGFYVDREDLLRGAKATVLVRPMLYVNSVPVSLKLLEDVTLAIKSQDLEGVATTMQVPDFALHEDRESVHEFRVPERLSQIEFVLSGKVKNLSRGEKDDLSADSSFQLNEIDGTDRMQIACFSRTTEGASLMLVGKTGEPLPGRPVQLQLTHRDFTCEVDVSVQTDEGGQIDLGPLEGIKEITADTPDGGTYTWQIDPDRRSGPKLFHVCAGEKIRVPYMGNGRSRGEIALFEMRGFAFCADRTSATAVKPGFIEISGLEPGNYELRAGERRFAIRVAPGETSEGYVLSPRRVLERGNDRPLQVTRVELSGSSLEVALSNASPHARVHVFATRFVPLYDAMKELGRLRFQLPRAIALGEPESFFVSGRDIGDEYRYILDRRYAKKYPGTMLKRPSMLLNPWAKDEADASRGMAGEDGGAYASPACAPKPCRSAICEDRAGGALAMAHVANLDFLSSPARAFLNLRPNEKGIVEVPRSDLGDSQFVRVVAVDPLNTVVRDQPLPASEHVERDLRLPESLDSGKHFTERKMVSVLKTGDTLVIRDVASAKVEIYDTLAKAHKLLGTLSGSASALHPLMKEFDFVVRWPKLSVEEKREAYSKYACHELHYFLFRKDPEFFASTIRPYLKNKRDKTFLDDALLGTDLDGYLKPWAYSRLNAFERGLLGQLLERERAAAARHLRELCELARPPVGELERLFQTAVGLGGLEADDSLRLDDMKEMLEEKKLGARRSMKAKKKAELSDLLGAMDDSEPDEDLDEEAEEQEPPVSSEPADGTGFFGKGDLDRREAVRQLFRAVEKTKEWVENNYYHVLMERHNYDLVPANAFWRDFAAHENIDGFLSSHLAEVGGSFPGMMTAIAALGLPFEAPQHGIAYEGNELRITAAGPMIVYHKETAEVEHIAGAPILVSQNFFDPADRHMTVDDEEVEKYVTTGFVAGKVYGCKAVLTNPSSTPYTLDVLLQVPQGAMPVQNGFKTRGRQLRLDEYETEALEYCFYFPMPGKFSHYPVQVARDEKVLAFASPCAFDVASEPSGVDESSWEHVSQNGTGDDVLKYLQTHNVGRIELDEIAWRMREGDFFSNATEALTSLHAWDDTLWSYAIFHKDVDATREYLRHRDDLLSQCGICIESPLVTIDPIERCSYQHMEYSPLVNARAHRFGKRWQIPNVRFHGAYLQFLSMLSYRNQLDDDDMMSVVYYLLLQDRVTEAAAFFTRVDPARIESRIQYDYAKAYLSFCEGDAAAARAIADGYAEYPVDRWRKVFAEVLAQADEIEGKAPAVIDEKDRDQAQARLAATEPSLELEIEAGRVEITYRNVAECRVSYYRMDLELLFSRNPFVQEHTGQFSFVRPNDTATIALPAGETSFSFEIPEAFRAANVMVEIEASGIRRSAASYASALSAQLVENYGQLRVTHVKTGKALPGVYVKVYVRRDDARTEFYKDGYTDLRGRFDYVSLSDEGQGALERFAVLVLSETDGGLVREAAPPMR